ncbi:hypothetical protein WAK64_20560 [Bacillus spongiae]|uniref:Fur-regulated basic protein FbpA n=1 Tax=Bacillus spongiae TaxID=2683610 RepID=A0ABU8HJZ4_9BACI
MKNNSIVKDLERVLYSTDTSNLEKFEMIEKIASQYKELQQN